MLRLPRGPVQESGPELRVQRLPHAEGLSLPDYQTPGSAGMDLRAAHKGILYVEPGQRVLVPTGLRLCIPAGYEGQIRSRSGLAHKHGLVVLNGPGTVDSDYRGEVSVLLVNHGGEPVALHRGERVAQLIIAPVVQVKVVEVSALDDDTARGAGGFGSTGTR